MKGKDCDPRKKKVRAKFVEHMKAMKEKGAAKPPIEPEEEEEYEEE